MPGDQDLRRIDLDTAFLGFSDRQRSQDKPRRELFPLGGRGCVRGGPDRWTALAAGQSGHLCRILVAALSRVQP
jgi:hypothetical protein